MTLDHVGSEVLKTGIMKSSIFWDIMFCLPAGFILVPSLALFFNPEDGGDISLRNIS
jgi:hypothetical protein